MYDKKTEYTQGEVFYNNAAAFDDMTRWLLDDDWWREGFDAGNREMYLKPCGLMLLAHYRWHLQTYLKKLSAQYPGLINPAVIDIIIRLGESIPGRHQSQLWLNESVDSAITNISMPHDRALREKVAAYVENIKEMDQQIFNLVIGTEI